MKAFLSIKYRADQSNRERIEAIARSLDLNGVETVCIARDVEQWGTIQFTPAELMRRTFGEIEACDFVVIELTEKGVGVGIEAGYAHARQIPIVTIVPRSADVSETLRGISYAVLVYDSWDDLTRQMGDWVKVRQDAMEASKANRLCSLHVVGDSISMHYGPSLDKLLAGVLAYSRKPARPDDPESANGGDSSMVLEYLRSLPQPHEPTIDYLMINCGLHDIKRAVPAEPYKVPLEHYAANLREIVRIARKLSKRMIWVRTTPVVDALHNQIQTAFHRYARDVDMYNTQADAIMQAEGIAMIDLFTFTKNLGADIYCDHVHFKDAVWMQQAAFIAGALAQLIKCH